MERKYERASVFDIEKRQQKIFSHFGLRFDVIEKTCEGLFLHGNMRMCGAQLDMTKKDINMKTELKEVRQDCKTHHGMSGCGRRRFSPIFLL